LTTLQLAAELARAAACMRDAATGSHLERVNLITRLIATAVAPHYGLSDTFVEQVSTSARLHDIGKIDIPDAILLKPGRLDDAEMAVMRTHVEKGLEILERVLAAQGVADQEAARVMSNLVATHHERLDGTGYPAGLRGEQIPLEGRIVAVADVFDALTHTRPYRQSLGVDEGLAIVRPARPGVRGGSGGAAAGAGADRGGVQGSALSHAIHGAVGFRNRALPDGAAG
jgi:HD-GYP domain-containing protein (c-di-GMP phosphodiesterase class II)